MGYRDKNGIVGKYKGYDVCVVGYEDFTPAESRDNTIYAVRFKRDRVLTLVQNNKKIGYMNDAGEVDLTMNHSIPFNFYCVPVEKETKEETEVEKDILDTDIDYARYSAVVDKFFAELG